MSTPLAMVRVALAAAPFWTALTPRAAVACTACNRELQTGLFGSGFLVRLLTIAVPIVVGGLVATWAVRRLVTRWQREGEAAVVPVVESGMLLGLGMGGFLDGIILHQILQVHQMISNVLPPVTLVAKSVNMFWDGVFHVGAWVLTGAGAASLWRSVGRSDVFASTSLLWASALLGWGTFNVFDSLLNHYLFGYHNVVDASAHRWAWNLAFLTFGAVQMLVGLGVVARGCQRERESEPARAPPPPKSP